MESEPVPVAPNCYRELHRRTYLSYIEIDSGNALKLHNVNV